MTNPDTGSDTRPVDENDAPALGEPAVQTAAYTVNCVPTDSRYALTVERRGDRWAVKRGSSRCLGADGAWDYEPNGSWDYQMRPASQEDEWLSEHRFDLETALVLAKAAALRVTVQGQTVAEALRWAGSAV